MRVVITGASGNVGSTVRAALQDEPQVTAMGRCGRRPPRERTDATDFVAADVAADDLGPACRGADALVHLARAFHPVRDERHTHSGSTCRARTASVFHAKRRRSSGAPSAVPALVRRGGRGPRN
jgi:nucleoside-diphosphate-sugar epimerase